MPFPIVVALVCNSNSYFYESEKNNHELYAVLNLLFLDL